MSKYRGRARAEAARKGWEKRREKHNAQPNYGTLQTLPKATAPANIELAPELPVTYSALAGGMPKWEDPLLELDASAYVKMRRCLALKKALRKLSIRTAKLNWTIVGAAKPKPKPALKLPMPLTQANALSEDDDAEPQGSDGLTRAEAVKEIFGQIRGWSDFIEHCTGSLVEGTRFYQIKTSTAREGSKEPWAVPDFFMGARHRVNAGGDIEWDGAQTLVQQQRATGQAVETAKVLPFDQFVVHRPGGGSNPEGDLDMGVAIYNGVVTPWNRGMTSGDLWVRLFAVPAILAGANISNARPDRISAMLDARAAKLSQAFGENQGATTALSNDEMVRLLQADPGGITGIVAWQQYLEGLADDVVTLAALTSSAGVAQANRTGDTSVQRDNEDEAAFANAIQIAETFNRHVKPWIDSRNDLPDLAEGEADWYLWPCDPSEGDEQDVDVELEDELPTTAAPEDDPEAVKMFAATFRQQAARFVQLVKHGGDV